MKVAFKDDSFAFEFVRNLGFTYYGGADIGEMMATAAEITEGDFESWFTAWDKRAKKLLARADDYLAGGHAVSAREAYLRASTYFRMGEFYLHGDPSDPRILESAHASQRTYAKAASLMGPTWEPIEIPYEGTTLPGYFYKVDDSGTPRPTIVFHGGYDSSIEELYYFGAAAAVRRGYNCLTFDGPGQGLPMRDQGLPFRHDWEKVVTPAVDYALGRADVDGDRLALIGMSLGGYLAARAAAFEHRFKAAVFFDGVYDFGGAMQKLLPPEASEAYATGNDAAGDRIIQKMMDEVTNIRWAITQGLWSFKAPSIADFLKQTQRMSMQGLADRIQCACLVLEADGDMFFKGQPKQIFDELRCPKTFYAFGADDGAENHCQSGALGFKDEVIFNWIDMILTPGS
ncbi:alpha/beta hydrolase [Luteibacter sp. 329MFSha]|uniref:alpha/beta hydrolase family protein n=1 Tax=Luteibacter sp. 329MFSha TaxID=1798239 RepID=UPI0008D6941F|nr:alpha/beta hydrolase [Luteibacter sp. 329MFSha]SEV92395.1 Alpha/beta hydrolase family protein [Luteibacter sp. 329MFSha]